MPVRLGLSVHNAAAIRMEHLTGYVGGIVRSEKYKTGRDFFRLAGPAQRCIRTKCRHFICRESRGNQRRPNWSRRDRVYSNFLFRAGLRLHFILATRLFRWCWGGRIFFSFGIPTEIFAARECLSRAYLRRETATTKK